MLSIPFSGGASGMTDARRVTDVVDPSLTASWLILPAVFEHCAFLHLCHSGRLLLISAPNPLLAYPCCSSEKY